MNLSIGNKICEFMVKNNLTSSETVENFDRFQLIVDDLIASFPKFNYGNQNALASLKKRIGKLLTQKARALDFSEENLKQVKKLLFNTINNKMKIKAQRILKVGKNREIYSSDEEGESQAEDIDNEETGPFTKSSSNKKKEITRKKKYKIYDHDFKQEVCQVATSKGNLYAISKYKLSNRKVTSWLEAYRLNILGRGRKALDPAMEFNMCVWILKKIWNQIPLTQKIIRQKAATMKTIDYKFNGSKGWLEKFFLRHVELKSCFDIRSKLQLKEECARYHRSAFARLMKDLETLQQMEEGMKVIQGDLSEIIYKKGSHPLLKLENDHNLDKQKQDKDELYDLEQLKNLPTPSQDFGLLKIEEHKEQEEDDNEDNDGSSQEYEDSVQPSEEEQESDGQNEWKLEEDASDNDESINIYEQDQSEERQKKTSKVKMEDVN